MTAELQNVSGITCNCFTESYLFIYSIICSLFDKLFSNENYTESNIRENDKFERFWKEVIVS
jgi:hypothetical protein